MRKSANVFLVVGAVWIIVTCACGFFSMLRPGVATRWQQEPAPPEAITRIELGEAGEIIAFASDGSMYEFSYGSPSSWKEVTQFSGTPSIGMDCTPAETTNRIVLPPPGEEISRVRVDCVYVESAYHLEVALLEDGKIWSWEHDTYAYTDLFMLLGLLTTFGVGALVLLIGLGMMIYQKVKAG